MVSTKWLSNSTIVYINANIANQNIRRISEGFCDTEVMMLKKSALQSQE